MNRLFFVAMVLMAMGLPLMAQGQNNGPAVVIPSSIGMAIASGLCGLGQGKAVAGAAEGIARNPGAGAAIRFIGLLGLILIESLALYTLVVVFTKG
jgi:F-type H+-transporting ATPase subunit c